MFASYNMRKRRFIVQAPGGVVDILNLTSGSFTRTTSGSYYNGTTSSIAWSVPNVLRFENRGDGYGSLALLEGSRTNQVLQPFDLSNGTWTKVSTTATGSLATSPDGGSNASLLNFTNVALARATRTYSGVANNISASLTVFIKSSGSSATDFRFAPITKANARISSSITATPDWNRVEFTYNNASGTAAQTVTPDLVNGDSALARSAFYYGVQWEHNVSFPSSFISGGNAASTRGADILSFSSGTYPLAIVGSGNVYVDLYPYFASTEISSSGHTVWGTDDLNFVSFSSSASVAQVNLTSNGVSVFTQSVSFSRHQKLTLGFISNNISWHSASISGFTTGNGSFRINTPSSFPTGTIYIGATSSSLSSFFGRFSNFRNGA